MSELSYYCEIEAVADDGSMRLFTFASAPTIDGIYRTCQQAADEACRKANTVQWPTTDPGYVSADEVATSLRAGIGVVVHGKDWSIRLTPRRRMVETSA